MPNDAAPLQYLPFKDFSPGIYSRQGLYGNTGATSAPMGAATVDNTYRCIALPSGGLAPLPGRSLDLNISDASPTHTYAMTGFCIYGPVFVSAIAPVFGQGPAYPVMTLPPIEVHVIYEDTAAGARNILWRRIRYFHDNVIETIFTQAVATPLQAVSAPSFFTVTRANPGSPTNTGWPMVVASLGTVTDISTAGAGMIAGFPDPSNPTVTNFIDISGGAYGPVIAHQGRTVWLARGSLSHGQSAGATPTYVELNENVAYTISNSTAPDLVTGAIFGQEFPVGYGAWASITASDLLLIKHFGGAFLIQGDLNSPLVRRLPNVVSTGGIESVGATTPAGFVYGVNAGGVYAWTGGDSSQSISPQLEDGFWLNSNIYRYGGQFLGWGNWILTPNSYLYDTVQGSWWRIDDPALQTYIGWQRDPFNNVIYGMLPSFTSAAPRFASGYASNSPAHSFSWQSHPFFTNQGIETTIRELLVCAQNPGTVTITVTALDTGTVFSKALTFTTTSPSYQRVPNLNLLGSKFQLHIVSDGGGAAAPIVYEVTLGYRPGRHLQAR